MMRKKKPAGADGGPRGKGQRLDVASVPYCTANTIYGQEQELEAARLRRLAQAARCAGDYEAFCRYRRALLNLQAEQYMAATEVSSC